MQARLDSFACAAPLRLRVTGVSLMAYAAGEIGGVLERVATVGQQPIRQMTLRRLHALAHIVFTPSSPQA